MNFSEYEAAAARTMNKGIEHDNATAMLAMGLAGESGEVVDYLKKVFFHGHQFEKSKLVSELGDVLWYLSNMAKHFGITLEEVAVLNISKLVKRYPDGFDAEKSKNRDDK